MDRGEVLVAAHRLRRAAARNADVLAVTGWVIEGGGRIEDPGEKDAELERLRAQQEDHVAMLDRAAEDCVRLRAEVAVLQAAALRGDCSKCEEKAADLERVRGILREQNQRNDELYWEVERLKADLVVAGGGGCPVCEGRRASDAARQARRRARLLERRQTPGEDDRRRGERSAEWHEKHKAGVAAYQARRKQEEGEG